jgi:hypothetical protein
LPSTPQRIGLRFGRARLVVAKQGRTNNRVTRAESQATIERPLISSHFRMPPVGFEPTTFGLKDDYMQGF